MASASAASVLRAIHAEPLVKASLWAMLELSSSVFHLISYTGVLTACIALHAGHRLFFISERFFPLLNDYLCSSRFSGHSGIPVRVLPFQDNHLGCLVTDSFLRI